MDMTSRLEIRRISDLIPYERNARTHSPSQIAQLRRSLREFGFVAPVLIDAAGHVLAGHGRLDAAQAEGLTEAPCVLVEHLTETQRRAYILADNRLAESAGWAEALVSSELLALRDAGLDLTLTGFEDADLRIDAAAGGIRLGSEGPGHFWDQEAEATEESEAFEAKFVPKKTTDDCYTPANVYAAVLGWAVDRYDLQGEEVLRPFFPGGDYQAADYPAGSVVIDNPPFSILSEICRWYMERNVRFFLFAPGMSLFSIASGACNYLPVGVSVLFENGATISVSFVTNLGDCKIEIAPDLYAAISEANDYNLKQIHADLPSYVYPVNLVSVAINKLAKYGAPLRIYPEDAAFIRALDSQRTDGKAIYGGGFLLSEKAAAEKAAAAVWDLSDRERTLIASLGGGHG